MLDVTSSSRGVLIPRMTQAERSAIANPANSLLIYQTDNSPGYYYNSGTPSAPNWVALFTSATAGWSVTGNAGTNPNTHFIGTTDSTDFVFKTNNTEKLRITANGNVGIGTANPTAKFTVNGSIRIDGPSTNIRMAGGDSTGTEISFANEYNALGGSGGHSIKAFGNESNRRLSIASSSDYSEWFCVTKAGNVGIGTTNPTFNLEVGGSGRVFAKSLAVASTVGDLVNSAPQYGIGRSDVTLPGQTYQAVQLSGYYGLIFAENNAIRMTINGSNVGIGTTNPIAKLQVSGTIYSDIQGGNNFVLNTTGPDYGFISNPGAGIWTLGYGSSLSTLATAALSWMNNGNVGIGLSVPTHLLHLVGGAYCDGTGSWVSGSDKAYKRDIETLTKYGVQEILKLRPVTYIHKQDKNSKVQIGLIAQEVKELIPEIVEGEEGSMGIAYDRLVPVLVNAIKDQQKKIENLEQKDMKYQIALESLQKEIKNLKSKNMSEAKK